MENVDFRWIYDGVEMDLRQILDGFKMVLRWIYDCWLCHIHIDD